MLPGRVPSAPPGSTPEGKDGEISDEVVKWKDELNAKALSGVGVHDGPGGQTIQEWLALAGKSMTGTTEGLSNGVGRLGAGGMMGVVVAGWW
jgi:hypothetical protein